MRSIVIVEGYFTGEQIWMEPEEVVWLGVTPTPLSRAREQNWLALGSSVNLGKVRNLQVLGAEENSNKTTQPNKQ